MKKILLIIALCFVSMLYAATPIWVSHKPNAKNNTYRYVVESAVSNSEEVARNKAMGLVLQQTIMSLGLPFSSTQVETAIQTGRVESMATEFKIPINRVCTYTKKQKNGGVRVYVLCQVAVAGNIQVQFTEFRDCGSAGDDTDVSARPDEWALYETERYFSNLNEGTLTKGMLQEDLLNTLEDYTKKELISDINLKDSVLKTMIETQSYFDKPSKTGYVIAYLKRDVVVDRYTEIVEDEIETSDKMLEMAQSFLNEGNRVNAKSILQRIDDKLSQIEPMLYFMRTYSTSRHVERSLQDCKDLRTQVKEKKMLVAGGESRAKDDKIREFVRNASLSLKEGKLGDALRYLYGAQILLRDMPQRGSLTVENFDGQQENANSFIMREIKNILSAVQITFDGFLPGSDTEAKLSFRYKDRPVSSISYEYNDNTGWSDLMPVRDGWTVVTFPANNRPKSIHVRLEYRYVDEAGFDPELQSKVADFNTFSYDTEAKHIIPIIEKSLPTVKQTPQAALNSASSTDIHQNNVAQRITEKRHMVAAVDSASYGNIIEKVCSAIDARKYESVYTLFTEDGYRQFEKLIQYGKARIISREGYRFVKIGDDVMCRSIPMMFTFSKGKNTIENVVFTFKDAKIDGVQFALEERAARNVMADTRYSETSKLVLINFMENYKTAFALKRLDYIESVFADDAVIITGRVLQKAEMKDRVQLNFNNIEYIQQTKKEYMARLANSFSSKEWINIKFGATNFERSAQGEIYGIRLLQDYMSNNYGDRGYLFLLIDLEQQDRPLIRVRTWEPETGGNEPFDMGRYSEMTEHKY